MLSSYQLYRAKKKALELIHGAIDEQYAHLRRDEGHLLAIIGKDGNNQMLPVAFAVVEAETKEAWD